MNRSASDLLILFFGTLLLLASSAHAGHDYDHFVVLDPMIIDDPGNAADTTGFGAVADDYFINRYETTNAEYVHFLNAVAKADPNGLYNTLMGSDANGGITRSGSSPNFSYAPKTSFDDRPVNFVSFWDAVRYANWLHNGQPEGAQGSATTEDGAYTLTPATIASNSVTRNAGATRFIPSTDEWYKAAYYDRASASYYDYPAGSDTATTCAAAGATANTANCNNVVAAVTDVGAYTGAASPFGTFDQGGNVFEWSEAIFGASRGFRGGSWNIAGSFLAASVQSGDVATLEDQGVGFRVASGASHAACTGGVNSTDAEIYALIDELLAIADPPMPAVGIEVDGDDADWAGIPIFNDLPNDVLSPGTAGHELLDGAIAPLADRILLLGHTKGIPSDDAGAFVVFIEASGSVQPDAQIVLDVATGFHSLVTFDDSGNASAPQVIAAGGIELALSTTTGVVEVVVPYADLEAHGLGGFGVRSWVRGGLASFDLPSEEILDIGAVPTSFQLKATPFPLDPAVPTAKEAATSLAMPLLGQWLVVQGGYSAPGRSHAGYWGYDFSKVDGSMMIANPPPIPDPQPLLTSYYGYGRPIVAPIPGTIGPATTDDEDDVEPPVNDPVQAAWNVVTIDIAGSLTLSLGHLMKGSLEPGISNGVGVSTGDALGKVGNSGFSASPHLHAEINGAADLRSAHPIVLTDVRVSLNPGPYDPWARDCTSWEPRQGFLVGTQSAGVPAAPPWAAGALSALLLGGGLLVMHARRASSRRA